MNKIDTFEQFLQEKFMEEEPMLLDDDLPDGFDHWISNINIDDLIELGQEYGRYVAYETASSISDKITKITLELHDNK